jgi:4'-phosphopantetheinyl transferase
LSVSSQDEAQPCAKVVGNSEWAAGLCPRTTFREHIRRMKTSIEWSSMPPHLSISTGVVHVWAWDSACSAHDLNRYISLLSTDECLRMGRFRFEKDRVRYGVSHAILRILLGGYLGVQPSSIFFDQNKFGKPSLAQALMASEFTFNLSHTNGIGLLAVTVGLAIGVDIEEIRPVEYGTVEQYFSSREQSSLATLTGADWSEGFYNCWTRKEAILKAEGLGLNVRLDAFDVSLNPNTKAAVLGVRPNAGFTSNWHLVELRPAVGFVGALATSAVPSSVTCYTFAS